jgi:hypothetical protein
MEPATAHVHSELIDLIEAAFHDDATKIPGPAGRPPRNHVFRLEEFMKFQVIHPSVPRPPLRFSRWTSWQPINPPAPHTNAHFTISA